MTAPVLTANDREAYVKEAARGGSIEHARSWMRTRLVMNHSHAWYVSHREEIHAELDKIEGKETK